MKGFSAISSGAVGRVVSSRLFSVDSAGCFIHEVQDQVRGELND